MTQELEQLLVDPSRMRLDTRVRLNNIPTAEEAERLAEEREEMKRKQAFLSGNPPLPDTPYVVEKMRQQPELETDPAFVAVSKTLNPKPGSKDWELMTAMMDHYLRERGWSTK